MGLAVNDGNTDAQDDARAWDSDVPVPQPSDTPGLGAGMASPPLVSVAVPAHPVPRMRHMPRRPRCRAGVRDPGLHRYLGRLGHRFPRSAGSHVTVEH